MKAKVLEYFYEIKIDVWGGKRCWDEGGIEEAFCRKLLKIRGSEPNRAAEFELGRHCRRGGTLNTGWKWKMGRD